MVFTVFSICSILGKTLITNCKSNKIELYIELILYLTSFPPPKVLDHVWCFLHVLILSEDVSVLLKKPIGVCNGNSKKTLINSLFFFSFFSFLKKRFCDKIVKEIFFYFFFIEQGKKEKKRHAKKKETRCTGKGMNFVRSLSEK